ncbi:MAG: hypothetical protein HRT65_04805 [Flavobacteriaceae bacterium]|nr:hypothetical protein [Flavobacteriaceae bacterium]
MTQTSSKEAVEHLLIRLERNHQCVLRMAKNLNSYRYEPKDYEGFLVFRDLKFDVNELAAQQMQLFDRLHETDTSVLDRATTEVDDLFDRFAAIEKAMASYLLNNQGV